MVRLGVATLPEYIKNRDELVEVLACTIIQRKFVWTITNGEVNIEEARAKGLYEQLQTGNVHVYNRYDFTMDDFRETIKGYLNKTKE